MASTAAQPHLETIRRRNQDAKNDETKEEISTQATNSSSGASTSTMATAYQNLPTGNSFLTSFVRKLFKTYGEFCASQPWEVIVVVLVLLISVLTFFYNKTKAAMLEQQLASCAASDAGKTVLPGPRVSDEDEDRFDAAHRHWIKTLGVIGMSCLSILHLVYRFKKIHRIGSYIVLNISLTYVAFTFVLFCLVVSSAGGPDRRSVEEAWFLIPLLTDMQKVPRMAQIALCSSHSRRISENVANGMYILAPPFVFDTLAKLLLFGLGFLFGITKLEVYTWYAMVSIIVNALVFLTFYPAGISVFVDLMFQEGRPKWDVRQIIHSLPCEDSQSPVVHKFKVAATAFLLILHIMFYNFVGDSSFDLTDNVGKVILIAIVLLISIKFLFNDDVDEAKEMRRTYIAIAERKYSQDGASDHQDVYAKKDELDRASNSSTDEGISLGSSNKPRPPSLRGNDDSGSESAWSEIELTQEYKAEYADQEVQTVECYFSKETKAEEKKEDASMTDQAPRSVDECKTIMKTTGSAETLTDEEMLELLKLKVVRGHQLENALASAQRAVNVRRKFVEKQSLRNLEGLPHTNYDFDQVMGACCESVIGYMTLPVGVAGPLLLDGKMFHVPMATTEGCLVASVNRGCSALRHCGVTSHVTADGMTRGPVVTFPNITKMNEAKRWMEEPANFKEIKRKFDSTSRFARLLRLTLKPVGRELYIRFVARTGDAMGMNMLSKASEYALHFLHEVFPDMRVVSLSGNFCTDKKPAAINWLDGRGKSVVCEAILPREVVKTVLKTTPEELAELNKSKNLVGSAAAGSIGGFNAQAANVVTAIFIATGQDAAQNVASSNCLTQMEVQGDSLYMTVTMPSIEVGTVGGGTILQAQGTCLNMLGVRGSHPTSPGGNAEQLARVVCATVLAGELSLMSALAAGHLVRSHLRHNRREGQKQPDTEPPSACSSCSDMVALEEEEKERQERANARQRQRQLEMAVAAAAASKS